jgi:hypothetical protein
MLANIKLNERAGAIILAKEGGRVLRSSPFGFGFVHRGTFSSSLPIYQSTNEAAETV